MTWFFQNGNQLFILFLTPIAGLLFDLMLNRRQALYLFYFSIFLLLPILVGYAYVIPYAHQVLGLLSLSCFYCFFSGLVKKKSFKIIAAFVITGVALCVLGFFAFMDSMSGYQAVEKTWRVKNYKIEYVMNFGFSGKPVGSYQVSKYG
jgi:hypothetical protein